MEVENKDIISSAEELAQQPYEKQPRKSKRVEPVENKPRASRPTSRGKGKNATKTKRKNRKKQPNTFSRILLHILYWSVGIISALFVAFLIGLFVLWQKGWLPTPEELPRYKERLLIMLDGYYNARLPEGEVIGIDVSHYQGTIDWDELSFYLDSTRKMYRSPSRKRKPREVDFVIAKATQGAFNQDSYYNLNKQGAREHNILFGAYHFYSLNYSAKSQADNFIHFSGLQQGDIVPVLDVEPYKNRLPERDSVLQWLQIVEKYYDTKPIIYTSENCYNTYFISDKKYKDKFRKYPFWIARYGGSEPSHHHILWQAGENGKLAGISGATDINVFRGTMHDLRHYYTIK